MSILLNPYILSNIGTGNLAAAAATVSGSGNKKFEGTGALASNSATMSGAGVLVDAGRLFAEPATIAAAGTRGYNGSGALAAEPATIFSEPWFPSDIAGLSLWLDSTDIDTLYTDSAKTTPVTSTLDPVGCWADKSSNGWDFIQDTGAKRPTYVTYQMNNRPVIRAAGTNILTNAPNTNWTFLHDNTASTIFIVYRVDAGGTSTKAMFGTADDAITDDIGVQVFNGESSSGCYAYYYNGFSYHINGGNGYFPVNTPSIVSIQHDPGRVGDDMAVHNNMKKVDSYSSTSFTHSNSAPTYAAELFGPGTGIGEFIGDIAEVIIYNTYLSEADRDYVATYLDKKWRPTLTGKATIAAGTSTVSGAGTVAHAGAGSLASAATTISGVGHIVDAGYLYSGPATVTATGTRGYKGTGALVAGAASIYGTNNSPADFSGLTLWLDSSEISTLYTDSAKTTPVTSDADPVGCWADKSGNGHDFTTTTSAYRPLYKTNILNGKATIRGDGTSQLENNDRTAFRFLHNGSDNTVIIVYKIAADTLQYNDLFGNSNSGSGTGYALYIDSRAGRHRAYLGVTASSSYVVDHTTPIDSFLDDTATILQLDYVDDPAEDSYIYNNGVLVSSVYDEGITPDTGDSLHTLQLYCDGQYDYNFEGDIAEVLAYNGRLSSSERAALTTLLKAKWGIT